MPLTARLRNELMEIFQRLDREGKIHDIGTLYKEYGAFDHRFGPQALLSLDGEALLSRMFAPNIDPKQAFRSSMAYVLSFKKRPVNFGNIGNGVNPLAFGLRFDKEAGTWLTKKDGRAIAITPAEAADIATRHRDALVRAVEAIDRLPSEATDADYRRLQEEIERVAPGISGSAWGHKYLHMVRPKQIDDFHVQHMRDFHLVRLLQVPPPGEGLYLSAGRYVALARELDMPINQMATVLNNRDRVYYRHMLVPVSASAPYEGHLAVPSHRRLPADTVVAARDGQTITRIGRVLSSAAEAGGESGKVLVPIQWLDDSRWTLPEAERKGAFQQVKHHANQVAIEERLKGR